MIVYDPHTHRPLSGDSPKINYPDGAPEFKKMEEGKTMINWDHYDEIVTNLVYDAEALRFKTIAEFKDCMHRGGEVVFEWNGIEYGAFAILPYKDPEAENYYIAQSGDAELNRATEMRGKTVDDILEYMVGTDRLRDVITKVAVVERSF